MLKTKNVILYIFISIGLVLLFASFDAQNYSSFATAMNLRDDMMYRSITENMDGVYLADVEEQDTTLKPETETKEYSVGDSGEIVAAYKKILYYMDYLGYPQNDEFDEEMKTAMTKYQTDKSITVKEAGMLDVNTMYALEAEVLVYSQGKIGSEILDYQKTLQELGYIASNAVIDGTFDEATTTAIKEYQQKNSLSVTGNLNVDTQISLRKEISKQVAK